MDPFTTSYLSTLASEFTKNLLSAAGRRLKDVIGVGDKKMALERCVRAGVTAAVSRARVETVDEKRHVESIFEEFFKDEYTARELIGLMSAKPPDMKELRESFEQAGYVPEQVPGLKFREAAEAFKAGFLQAAVHEPLIREIIMANQGLCQTRELAKQTEELFEQTQVHKQILDQLQGLSEFMKSHASGITIQNGVILAFDPRTSKSLPFSPAKEGADAGDWEKFYLERLINHCDCLDLSEIDERCPSGGPGKAMKISDVFTTLFLEEVRRFPDQTVEEALLKPESERGEQEFSGKRSLRIAESGSGEKQEPVPVQAAEACGALRRILILGRPGGGKSTLVNHLSVSLAKKRRGEDIGESALSGWDAESGTLLPARIILRRFAAWVPDPPPSPSAGLVWDYLEYMLKDWSCPEFVEKMKLLLDEVGRGHENSKRGLILETIEEFATSFPKCRIVVTCREYAYREDQNLRPDEKGKAEANSWRLAASEFPSFKLALFHPEQIRFFTRAWYETTGKPKEWDEKTRESWAEELYKAVVDTPNLLELGRYPLLLTLMAQVHSRYGKLPRDRADLYESVVNLLLSLWEARIVRAQGDACQSAPDMAPGLNIPVDKLRRVLEKAALSAHQKQERQTDDRGSGCADISRGELLELLEAETDGVLANAKEAISYMEQRSGLIQAKDNRTFSFPHRTFQEYLAATAIVKGFEDYELVLKERLSRDLEWWREVFLLAAGYGRENAKHIFNLVEALLPFGPDDSEAEMTAHNAAFACLAAQAMAETRFFELASGDKGKKDGRFKTILGRVRGWLLAAINADQAISAKQRCEAGDALNHVGDPRFDPEHWYLPVGESLGFVEIPPGSFLMGSDKKRDPKAREDEFPRHRVELSGYSIGTYPVTVAQCKAYLQSEQLEPTDGWKDENKYDNRPVVEVSWHDAVKYCEWLTARLRENGRNVQATLPTEAQWERAARSEEYHVYPWGDDADANKLNCGETGIFSPSPVGCFPSGKSCTGLQDMSGNVWEWCLDQCDFDMEKLIIVTDTYQDGVVDPVCEKGSARVLRGGSWGDVVAAGCRAAYRYGNAPSHRSRFLGFRLVLLEYRRASA